MFSDLANELHSTWRKEQLSFHMPGHKAGRGAHPLAHELLGHFAFQADVSELGGFDYLHSPEGNLCQAQERAARIFGADHSFFLVNGSTVGNIAALLATVSDGDKVLVSRDSHRSVFAGLALSGATPVYLKPTYHKELDLYVGAEIENSKKSINAEPNFKAIHVTYPNYYGLCFDLKPWAELACRKGVPLIVDEAHGAHFGFHESFPPAALSEGADLAVQSPHKTLSSLTQSSVLHMRSQKINEHRLRRALHMLQSSSPSALLLISLDITFAQMEIEGQKLLRNVVELADQAREQINSINGLHCSGKELVKDYGIKYFDPSKLIVDVTGIGLTGFEAAKWLHTHRQIGVEIADSRHLVCSLTIADSADTLHQLIAGLRGLAMNRSQSKTQQKKESDILRLSKLPDIAMPIRRALCSPNSVAAFKKSAGRVSAEYIVPYPPGIPLIVPGEIISFDLLNCLSQLKDAGYRIGLSDRSMETVQVIAST